MSKTTDSVSPSALELMHAQSDLKAGGPTVATLQPELAPGFRFGLQLAGTKDALKGKRMLVFGAGDAWFKFVRWAVDHLGIQEKDITIIERAQPDPRLKWQYGDINIVTRDQLQANPSLIKGENFDFATVLTPPGAHLENMREAFELGLPVMVEKPAFTTPAEYKEFEALQKQHKIPAYFIDWEVPLAATLYSALGHEVPFGDSITFKNREGFSQFDINNLENVTATFVEGRGNPLVAAGHRPYLQDVRQGGILSDMGAHAIQALTVLGFKFQKVKKALLGKPTKDGKLGVYEQIGHEDTPVEKKTAEWYARVDADMSFNGQQNIPVTVEAAKLAYENDMRIELKDKKGNLLKYDFGHQLSEVTLTDSKGKVIAQAKGNGDPYAFMFMQANHTFEDWKKNDKSADKAIAVYGDETHEMLKVVEAAHQVARSQNVPAGTLIKQIALENGTVDDTGTPQVKVKKRSDYKEIKIKDREVASRDEHWTAEGPVFDAKTHTFWWTDIERGQLIRYDPATHTHNSWELASKEMGKDGRPRQMIGGTTAVNEDGNIIFMLDSGGPNAGLNYFDPTTAKQHHIGQVPAAESEGVHSQNRPNDSTMIEIGGKNYLLVGTMSKKWNDVCEPDGSCKRLGGYYLIDPDTFESKRLSFENNGFPEPLITNGLADGGDLPGGKKRLFWSETVEDPGLMGKQLNVYRGELDPKTLKVSKVEVFADHQQLGGSLNGRETFGRPDGANMALYHGKPVYGISVLETGTIKFFDPETKELVLDLKLPDGATRNTKFALGDDGNGHKIGLVTTLDEAFRTRRKGASLDGLNGSVITFALPDGLEAMPQTTKRVHYPALNVDLGAAEMSPPKRAVGGR